MRSRDHAHARYALIVAARVRRGDGSNRPRLPDGGGRSEEEQDDSEQQGHTENYHGK